MTHSADYYIEKLKMKPHFEGGWYADIWRSDLYLPQSSLPQGVIGRRHASSLIYYLLKKGELSRPHKLRSDEVWLWQAGGTLALSLADKAEKAPYQTIDLGCNLHRGEALHAHIPRNMWQSAVVSRGDFVLVSCVVTPAFEKRDFTMV